ncbi:MAG: DUF5819 family protein [Flavobacteriales bacterium]
MRQRRILIGILAAHTLLLALYTFPHQLVPERLRIIGQLYARPLFHQQWRLFAPDPPLCDCQVQVKVGEEEWRSLLRQGDGYLDRRMAQTVARNLQRAMAEGSSPDQSTLRAMHAMVRDIRREQPNLRYRLVERCVVAAEEPVNREARITEIEAR